MENEPKEGKKYYNFFLNMNDARMRIIRRAMIVGVLTAVSVGLTGYAQIAPEYFVPIIAGVLAAVEKLLREHKK